MIKKLQRRFVFIAMLSFTIVLTLVAAAINGTMRVSTTRNADATLEFLANNQGALPVIKQEDMPNRPLIYLPFAQEHPMEVRYFTVEFDTAGNVIETDTEYTFLMSDLQAISFGTEAFAIGKTQGYFQNYRYHIESTGDGYFLIGLDCIRQMSTLDSIFTYSIGIVIISLIVVLALLLFFSKRVTAPISNNLEHQKQFITDAGHEIKTPLTIISANNDILKIHYGENEWTHSIDNQVKRLDVLVGQMLFLSNLEDREQERHPIPVDITALLRQVVGDFQVLFEKEEVDLIFSPEQMKVQGYPLALENLFHILLDNMVRYTPPSGQASVIMEAGKKRVIFENTLDAPLQEEPNRLFDRFYRRESSRSREKGGNGIGLSIARLIARRHQGTLTAHTKDNTIQFILQF